MKTICFNEQLYAVRDWLELTGRDWQHLAAFLDCAVMASSQEMFDEAASAIIQLLVPHIGDPKDWTAGMRTAFLLKIVVELPYPDPLLETAKQIRNSILRMAKPPFQAKLGDWIDRKEKGGVVSPADRF